MTTPAATPASALVALARRAADEGAYERVADLYRTARSGEIARDEADAWRRLLVEAGDFDGAREVALRAGRSTVETDVPATPEAEAAGDEFLDFEPGEREPAPSGPLSPLVATFLRWFAGRGDVYARQWHDARHDRTGYWPVREPLSERVAANHLLRRHTIGQYVLHPDQTVSFAALDLDPTAEALEHVRLAGQVGPLGLQSMVEYAGRLVSVAERADLPLVAEDTGGMGLHLWLLFAPRLPAARARALLRDLLWRSGPQPPSVAVEIFPKQDALSGKGLGNLIKLPLGIHQATLRPSRLLGTDLRPREDAEALSALRPCNPAAIDGLLAARVVPLTRSAIDDSSHPRLPPLPEGASPRRLAEALAAVPPGREAAEAVDRMLQGCAILRELARQAHEEQSLPPGAAQALVYTVGLVGRDNERIDELLKKAGTSRKELDRVRRGLQSPSGCKRLREHFGDLAGRCACPEPPPGGYPTPALFALRTVPRLTRSQRWPLGEDVDAVTVDSAPSDLEQRLARIEALLDRLAPRET